MWPVLFLFIPTLLIGSSFPLISSLALKDSSSDGKTIGTVYFFNILGNVLGGIVTGFILLPIIGTELTLLIFSVIGLLFGFFVKKVSGFSMSISKRAVMVVATIVVAVMIFPAGGELYKAMHVPPDEEHDTYFEEGVAGVVMTYENKEKEKVWNFINGVAHGARPEYMFYYEAAEAISYAQKVENALVIGYGTGSIVEMALKMDSLKKLKLVEINDALIKNLSKMDIFRDMLSDKRIDLVIDDGRRVLLNTDDKYDLIMIDPLRSTSAYSNNIYSKQFFELVKARLSPGGIFMVWRDEYRVLPKTVLAAFDYTKTYSFFSLASNQPMKQYESQRQKIMSTFSEEGRRRIAKWTDREWEHTDDLEYIENLVKDYPINEDWKPVAEYYLGLQFREKFLMK
ncbi:fused MFS/spermidine synthase [bacterium]|nr:fused MFS/spermidine synthase [bacterium]